MKSRTEFSRFPRLPTLVYSILFLSLALASNVSRAEPATVIYNLNSYQDSYGCDISLKSGLAVYEDTDESPILSGTRLLTGESFPVSPQDQVSLKHRYTCDSQSLSGDGKLMTMSSSTLGQAIVNNLDSDEYQIVSVNNTNIQGNQWSRNSKISENGGVVAFESEANNLAAIDKNGEMDVFARNLKTGKTFLVSGSAWWNEQARAQGASWLDAVSENGRFITFTSKAANLTAKDSNKGKDVFIKDLWSKTLRLVSMNQLSKGTGNRESYGSSVSADGRYVAFASFATDLVGDKLGAGIFIRDLRNKVTKRVAAIKKDQLSYGTFLSGSGRYIGYGSWLTGAEPTTSNIFLHDVLTHKTVQLNLDSKGNLLYGVNSLPVDISTSGRFVAFFNTYNENRGVKAVIRRLW